MEIESAARRYLLGQSAVTSLVGQRVWKHALFSPLDGTGHRAIVVARDGWHGPLEDVRTVEFPVLAVTCWADATRDADGRVVAEDAADSAWGMHRVIDSLLHGQRAARWDRLVVVHCRRWAAPALITAGSDVSGHDGAAGTRGVEERSVRGVRSLWAVEVGGTLPDGV